MYALIFFSYTLFVNTAPYPGAQVVGHFSGKTAKEDCQAAGRNALEVKMPGEFRYGFICVLEKRR